MSKIKSAKPTEFITASTFWLTGEPLNFSTISINARPPSSAGKGIMFNIAKFTDINATNWSKNLNPTAAACPVILAIPIGPETPAINSPFNNKVLKRL